jgi:hypothetical protein
MARHLPTGLRWEHLRRSEDKVLKPLRLNTTMRSALSAIRTVALSHRRRSPAAANLLGPLVVCTSVINLMVGC